MKHIGLLAIIMGMIAPSFAEDQPSPPQNNVWMTPEKHWEHHQQMMNAQSPPGQQEYPREMQAAPAPYAQTMPKPYNYGPPNYSSWESGPYSWNWQGGYSYGPGYSYSYGYNNNPYAPQGYNYGYGPNGAWYCPHPNCPHKMNNSPPEAEKNSRN